MLKILEDDGNAEGWMEVTEEVTGGGCGRDGRGWMDGGGTGMRGKEWRDISV